MAAQFSPPKPHQILLNISFLFLIYLSLTSNLSVSSPRLSNPYSINPGSCEEFEKLQDRDAKCSYLSNKNNPCSSQGYIDYLHLFYCALGERPFLGCSLLALCLLLLFYLLADTASIYFCSSLDSLSTTLSLPPTVAGVTLLSLGNGAPDAFATIASFATSGGGDVGLSSVLGGSFFVTSAVVGVISVCVGPRVISIDRFSFVREICFYLIVLCSLLGILIVGEIGVLGAILFASLYVVYVVIVVISYCWRKNQGELEVPLLESVDIEEPIYLPKEEEQVRALLFKKPSWLAWSMYLLQLPLYLPRRLTIPDVSEDRWSKPFAVVSVILSPILLATLWNSKLHLFGSEESLTIYLFAGLVGLVLGVIALETTDSAKPPNKFQLPWLAGEFLMSVVWFYITAGELVSLLVSVGHILRIGPSILAVTVLAWGNSIGDLIANVAMALNGGEDGVQIAISGCYAVPIFNTLVGLGMSLVFTSWAAHPTPYVIPQDSTIMVTLGFLVCGLLWAMVMLPKRGMKLDRVFGVGLLALYMCFLCLRVCDSIGLLQIDRTLVIIPLVD